SDEKHHLLVNIHHIVADGWSIGLLIKELGAFYAHYHSGAEVQLTPLAVQYGDYASWQREYQQEGLLSGELEYWQQRLANIPQVHNLPLDKARPAEQQFAGRTLVSHLDTGVTAELKAACQSQGVTLFMYLQAVFAALLHRYSGEHDIVMGTPVAGRTHQDIEPLIGMFVNTLVLRNDLSDVNSFEELLAQSKERILEAQDNQHVPFDMLVDELNPERSLSHSPIFQVLFTLQNNEQV
ncbi:condensation domain-containing protein, partial [Pseudoalteromonas piscicida]